MISGNLRIPAVFNAPVFKPHSSNSEGQLLPCVVFSHGLGGNRLINSAFCCDLASRGCLVTCIEHRYGFDLETTTLHIVKSRSEE